MLQDSLIQLLKVNIDTPEQRTHDWVFRNDRRNAYDLFHPPTPRTCFACSSLKGSSDPTYCHVSGPENFRLPVRRPEPDWYRVPVHMMATGCPTCSILSRIASNFLPKLENIYLRFIDYTIYREEVALPPLEIMLHYSESDIPKSLELICYCAPGTPSPWPLIGARSPISEDTGSEMAIQIVKTWISRCLLDHPNCPSVQENLLPDRILCIKPTALHPEVNLNETTGKVARYVCLSHCWGQFQPLTTTSKTIQTWRKSIPWSKLPKTFQDAITFTLALDVEYIWIDSLCIIQDDPEDWRLQSASMATIYQGAFLTIAASKSRDSTGGCFSRPGPTELTIEITGTDPDTQEDYLIYAQPALTHLSHSPQSWWINDFPLLSRGWVYQERLLSPRFLHFGPRELTWECANRITCECEAIESTFNPPGYIQGGKILHHKISSGTKSVGSLAQRWHLIIQEFTNLSLTKPSDQLPALAGMAQAIGRGRRSRYIAGLWEDSMILDLCWATTSPPSRRPVTWRAPTWSWASLETGKIGMEVGWYVGYERREEAVLREVDCQPQNPDPTGLVTTGLVKIRGKLAGFPLCYDLKSSNVDKYYIQMPGGEKLRILQDYDYKSCAEGDVIEWGETVYVMKLASIYVKTKKDEYAVYICLRAVAPQGGIFERIGHLGPGENRNDFFDHGIFEKTANLRTIAIQ